MKFNLAHHERYERLRQLAILTQQILRSLRLKSNFKKHFYVVVFNFFQRLLTRSMFLLSIAIDTSQKSDLLFQ